MCDGSRAAPYLVRGRVRGRVRVRCVSCLVLGSSRFDIVSVTVELALT